MAVRNANITLEAQFVRGNPEFRRYKPVGAVAAGTVVQIGTNIIGITHSDIAAGEWGNVSVGPGVYEVVADADLAIGAFVDWDDTAKKVTATTTGDFAIGKIVPGPDPGADDDICWIELQQPIV